MKHLWKSMMGFALLLGLSGCGGGSAFDSESGGSSDGTSVVSCSNTLDACPNYETVSAGLSITTLTGTPTISTQQLLQSDGSSVTQACVVSGTGTACLQ